MAGSSLDDHTDALLRREVEWIVRASGTHFICVANES